MHSTVRFALAHRGQGGSPGSVGWAAQQLWPQVREVVSKWRLISGDSRYDKTLRTDATPYVAQLLGGGKKQLLDKVKQTAQGNAERFEMLTSEVLFTDRIFIRGYEYLYAMYGGGIGDTSGCPGWAVRWEKAGEELAAWVVEATPARFRAPRLQLCRERTRLRHAALAPRSRPIQAGSAPRRAERPTALDARGSNRSIAAKVCRYACRRTARWSWR